MSFKQFSTAQDTPNTNKPDEKAKAAPATVQPAIKADESSGAAAAPASKAS